MGRVLARLSSHTPRKTKIFRAWSRGGLREKALQGVHRRPQWVQVAWAARKMPQKRRRALRCQGLDLVLRWV